MIEKVNHHARLVGFTDWAFAFLSRFAVALDKVEGGRCFNERSVEIRRQGFHFGCNCNLRAYVRRQGLERARFFAAGWWNCCCDFLFSRFALEFESYVG